MEPRRSSAELFFELLVGCGKSPRVVGEPALPSNFFGRLEFESNTEDRRLFEALGWDWLSGRMTAEATIL